MSYVGRGSFKLINSRITGCANYCTDFTDQAGGLSIGNNAYYPGTLNADIINCIFGDNYTASTGGAGVVAKGGPSRVNFYNNIFYGNSPRNVAVVDDLYEPGDSIFVSFHNNIIDSGNVLVSDEAEVLYSHGNLNTDPLWSLNLPYFPGADSPCIDSGTIDLPDSLLALLPDTDLLGNPRIYGEQIDLGCYEWNPNDIDDTTIPAPGLNLSNHPNPFNPETRISYSLPEKTDVRISIYNVRGQLVRTLVNDEQEAGDHFVIWNGRDGNERSCASGVYFYRVKAGLQQRTHKMLLLK